MCLKNTKWGIKAWILADAKNSYMYNFKLYTGKSIHNLLRTIPLMLLRNEKDGSAEKGLAHRVVMELVSPLSNMCYRVYTDNFYSSHTLFLDLKQKGF